MLPSVIQEVNHLRTAGTPYRNLSIGTTGAVVRASAGEVIWYHVTNTDASAMAYLKLYNKATAPTSGDTPIYTIGLPPRALVAFSLGRPLGGFTAGIGVRASLNAADADNTAPTSAVVLNMAHVAAQ